jgi:hypothetical protein
MERKLVISERFEARKINLTEKRRKRGCRNEILKTVSHTSFYEITIERFAM